MLVDSPTLAFPGLLTDSPTDTGTDMADQSWQTPQAFRQGIAHLAGGVTVVTSCDDDGARFGVTTTSVCALSMDPPTLVACIRRRSKLGRNLGRTRRFCVNVLSCRQRAVAEAFAGTRGVEQDRFRHGRWAPGVTGLPVLEDTLASFECAIDLVYGYPNHLIVIGSVQNVVRTAEAADPLVYVSRKFTHVDQFGAAMAAAN
ncbi:MAG: flavin reductase family protein [Pseudonocardiaceae bacterium]